jgi:cytochrome c peroxidase
MQKRALLMALFVVTTTLLIVPSCRKKETDTPHQPAPGPDPEPAPPAPAPGTPHLPAQPYDYEHTGDNMPMYISDFIRASPGIDNTPAGNPVTNAGATLGRVLFYDKALSVNNTTSCGSCHHQDKAFTDGKAVSTGFNGGVTRRNAMSVVNLRFFKAKKMFWDLRADDLETQVLMPIQDQIEMGMPSLTALEEKLRTITYYPALFQNAFGTPEINRERIGRAMAQFLRSVVSFESKYDQGLSNNLADLSAGERRGLQIMVRFDCVECHSDLTHVSTNSHPSFLIVENSGVNTGFGSNNGLDLEYADNGIGEITQRPMDQGTFKIPALRNVALTAPYMHDGRFATLEEVIEHYSSGMKAHPNRGIQFPRGNGGFQFSAQDKADVVAFLKTLTDASLANDPKYADPFTE